MFLLESVIAACLSSSSPSSPCALFAAGLCLCHSFWQLLLKAVGFQQVRNVYYANHGNQKHQHLGHLPEHEWHSFCQKASVLEQSVS